MILETFFNMEETPALAGEPSTLTVRPRPRRDNSKKRCGRARRGIAVDRSVHPDVRGDPSWLPYSRAGTVSIRLVASKIATCAAGKRGYMTLRYVFVGGSPWAGVPADMKTSNYIAGAGRPLPPANQTVSLTCA
jgi:hypothetical protein